MRIVIDARMLYWTGVGRYIDRLLASLQKLDHENEYLVLVRREDWKKWSPEASNFKKVEVNINPYSFGEQIRLPVLIKKLKPDLVHFTTPNTPVMFWGKRAVTIHDLTLLDFDTSRGTGFRKLLHGIKRWPFRLVFWNDAKNATVIITGVQFVKQQLIERYGVDGERVVVAPLGVAIEGQEPVGRSSLGISGDYILYVGNFYPYKNVGVLIDAFRQLKTGRPDLKLVLVGKTDFFGDRLKQKTAEMGLNNTVRFTGFVDDAELVWLYANARAYVNPSLSEGFGLQGFEAMYRGLPVLAAKASCLPEVYEQAAEYFDPGSSTDLAEKLDRLLDDKEAQEKLRQNGFAQIKKYSWDQTGSETLRAYHKAMGS